jgi:hypothetical protein
MPTRRSLLVTLAGAGLAGCSLAPGSDGRATPVGSATPPAGTDYWYTHPQATGNRLLSSGNVRDADPVRFDPGGRPQWLVAHPAERGSQWTVVTADGRASRWHVRDGTAERAGEYDPLPAETQPVVATGEGQPRLVRSPADMAPRTSPVVAPATAGRPARLLYVAGNGDVVVAGERRTRLGVDALGDGRLAALGDGRYALFAEPTDRYRHGALGDTTEGAALAVVDATDPAVEWTTALEAPAVFEGLQPLVADFDGDGDPEVVTTVADAADGARIAVFGADGQRIATGPVYGPGWRHQLAVAPFAPDGSPELAVVRKPHVDRVVEFYRLGDGLSVTATVEGVSTHTYGSRTLDGALAGDLDRDGRTELLAPTTGRETLVAVRRTRGGAEVGWRRPLDGPVRSNLAGVAVAGGVAVGVGTSEGVTVWQA